MRVCNKYYIECKLADSFGYCQEPVCIKKFQLLGNNNNSEIFNSEIVSTFLQPVCGNCSNNPKNGGSGICNCILGQIPWK